MSKDALQELEIKVAFLEDALNKLSDEHYAQQKEMEKLKQGQALILDTLKGGGEDGGEQSLQQYEVPPHY